MSSSLSASSQFTVKKLKTEKEYITKNMYAKISNLNDYTIEPLRLSLSIIILLNCCKWNI